MHKALAGQSILITRARDQSAAFRNNLESLGAKVVELPLIKIIPPADITPLDKAIDKINGYHWIIFTSVNGVEFFFERLTAHSLGINDAFGMSKVVAIGPATAKALTSKGVIVESVPNEFKAEGVIELFSKVGLLGQRVLIPRAKEAREILPDALREMGAQVDVPVTYETVADLESKQPLKEALEEGKLTVITFTSSSTVKNFIQLTEGLDLKELLKDVAVASIGPITSKTAEKNGLEVKIEAKDYTVEGLVVALTDYFAINETITDKEEQ